MKVQVIVALAVLLEKTKEKRHKDVLSHKRQGMNSINCKEKMWKRNSPKDLQQMEYMEWRPPRCFKIFI